MVIMKNAQFKIYKKQNFCSRNYYDRLITGFELINTSTNKVIYRKGKFSNSMDSMFPKFTTVNKIFVKNI